jgi:hypothetical protein
MSITILFFCHFDLHFLCSPKENEAKEKAPGVPLDPALLETRGALSNSAPKQQGPQTAKGPYPPASAMLGAGRWEWLLWIQPCLFNDIVFWLDNVRVS